MSWKDNSLMFFVIDGVTKKVSDHNRSALNEDIERIENKQRMVDGTLRRYSIIKKRTWSCSWDLLPSVNVDGGLKTADGGMGGVEMENIANVVNAPFRLILRKGSARGESVPAVSEASLPYTDENFYIVNVMISEFSKEVIKRGPKSDMWNVSLTLEEV